MANLSFRIAVQNEASVLAEMNQQLIRDEGHRNKMTLPELKLRMSKWLEGEYAAVIFSEDNSDIGYALYRQDEEWIYLRQIFVKNSMRRKGLAKKAISWLKEHCWKEFDKIRIEVLVGNIDGISFWKAVGFKDYCITMELDN